MDTLQQPQLGQTILALRQEKKLTQEELVEQCNLNVRTLQRIEAGEVTPRDFTLKAIFSALDFQIEQVASSIKKRVALSRIQIGWIAGIVYFVIGFIETGMDYSRFGGDDAVYFSLIYTLVKTISLVSFGLLMLGFVAVGTTYKSSLLKISAYLMIGSFAIVEFYDIISIFSQISAEDFILIKSSEAVIFGSVDIVLGIAIFRLGTDLGVIAKVTGIFEIVAGALFVTFILAFFGLILLIPATILEIILLHKCYENLSSSTQS